MAVWFPWYAWVYGFTNFLSLCDLAAILTCIGLWTGSALLISSQAISSLVIDLVWDLDVLSRLVTGRHWIGGTEYMWDPQWALGLRLLSLFHAVWPLVLLWGVRRTGYDRRGLPLQCAIAGVVMILSRLAGPEANLNFSWRDPLLHGSFGAAPLHLAITFVGLVLIAYLPTHALLVNRSRRPNQPDTHST
jgi:hypothetical protein